MKNLKKVLALVLAFACAFTMFAGAAFTDQADISQTEAVDMLTALNVIEGYEDGSFRPDEIVTRAEMAKMIYVIRNGGSDVVTQYEGYKTPFTDVENVNHWAKGYIAYCYANGIIAGTSATTFEPDRAVTGQEAAKMALVLLGYDPDRAGLVGTAWGTNTINLATQKDLFKDYSTSITAGSPRQFAAQLLYNTLWACTVRWSDDSQSYEDVVTYQDTGDGVTAKLLNVTVAKKYMGLEEVTGIYAGDSQVNTGLKNGESYVTIDGKDKIMTFVPAEGNVLIGQSVKVLYKESKDGVTGLDKKDTVYGVTLTDDTSIVTATLGDVDKGDDNKNQIEIDGTKYDVYSNSFDVITNYVVDDAKRMTVKEFNAAYKDVESADEIRLVLNDSDEVVKVYLTETKFYEVTGLTSSKITLAGLGTIDIDEKLDLDDTVEQGDAVALTSLYDAWDGDDVLNVITKAEVVADVTVDAMRNQGSDSADKNPEVRIDGSYAKHAFRNDYLTRYGSDYAAIANVDLDGTYDFVMYNGYWVAAKEISAASKNIAMVTKTASGINDQVKVMLSDGSETTYNIDDDDGDASNLAVIEKGAKLYSYTISGDDIILKNDSLYTADTYNKDDKKLQSVNGLDFAKAASASYNEDNKTITIKGKGYVTADNAVAFVTVGNDNYTYTIDNIKSFGGANDNNDASNVEYVLNNDNEVVAFYAVLERKPGATTSNDEYGYVINNPSRTTIDGDRYTTFTVWNGTEEVEINVDSTSTGVVKGDFVKYAIDSNNIADSSDVEVLQLANTGAVYNYNANRQLLTLAVNAAGTQTNTYAVADDVVIIGVNTDDEEGVEGYTTVAANKNAKGEYLTNIVYVLNDDDEVVAIFTDSDQVLASDSPILDREGDAVIAD